MLSSLANESRQTDSGSFIKPKVGQSGVMRSSGGSSNGAASTQNTTPEESQLEKIYTPQTSHIVTQVEPSFFDELGKDSPLWIQNPWENPKVMKMNLSKKILHEGWLYKKSRDEQLIFKARYFVLYEDRLEVFRDQKEMKTTRASNIMLLGSVRLDLRPICEDDLKQLNERERYFLMFLSCKMRFFLFAKDQETQNKWISQLKQTCILTNYSQTYENLKVLGKGTFAKVFLARKVRGGGEFAVKTFDKKALLNSKSSEKTRTGLLNEISILRKCDHPSIIKLFEVYESDNYIYLVQNVLRGGELFDTIIKTGSFSEKNSASTIKQLLSALEYIHAKGIMHRDIKPENLILVDNTNEEELQIKLADFGLAAFTTDELLFKRCGTPGYVAPEILDDQKYNQKVDIFSAGIILYILLTGCSPFYGKSYNEILLKNKTCNISFDFSQLGVKVSHEATDLLKRMLQVNPDKRISAGEALNHAFFTKSHNSQESDKLNTSMDSLDTGCEESTAFENMLQFQSSRFNVQNIKPSDVKNLINQDKELLSMTPMLGGKYLKNPQGDDIHSSKERWMSPEKKVKPGDCKHLSSVGDKNEYMHKLMCARKSVQQQDEDNIYQFRQTTSIPETPMQSNDSDRKITSMKPTTTVISNTNNTNSNNNTTNNNNNNNSSSTVKDKLKNLL